MVSLLSLMIHWLLLHNSRGYEWIYHWRPLHVIHGFSNPEIILSYNFLKWFFTFFQTPTKQVVLQTENGNQLPATQKRMTKHTQYDILYVRKKGNAPSTGDKCSKKNLLFPKEERVNIKLRRTTAIHLSLSSLNTTAFQIDVITCEVKVPLFFSSWKLCVP